VCGDDGTGLHAGEWTSLSRLLHGALGLVGMQNLVLLMVLGFRPGLVRFSCVVIPELFVSHFRFFSVPISSSGDVCVGCDLWMRRCLKKLNVFPQGRLCPELRSISLIVMCLRPTC